MSDLLSSFLVHTWQGLQSPSFEARWEALAKLRAFAWGYEAALRVQASKDGRFPPDYSDLADLDFLADLARARCDAERAQ